MRHPALARDLVPIHEFRAELATWLDRVEKDGGPVVITQRGRAAAVLISPASLDELEDTRDLLRRVLRGLDDVAHDRSHEDEAIWDKVDTVLGAMDRDGADPVA